MNEKEYELPCENCGAPVYFDFHGSGEVAHFGCDHCVVSMIVHHPRKLGVVSATTDVAMNVPLAQPLSDQRWRIRED